GRGGRVVTHSERDQPRGPAARIHPRVLTLSPPPTAPDADRGWCHALPVIRDGLDAFAAVVTRVRDGVARQKLRVTTTNAFATRGLVPRLPLWREANPEIPLEVIGTDTVIDVAAGNADVAIRYGYAPPSGLPASELLRDRFWPVASPKLLAGGK